MTRILQGQGSLTLPTIGSEEREEIFICGQTFEAVFQRDAVTVMRGIGN